MWKLADDGRLLSNNEKRNKAVGYPGPLKVAYYYYRYADPLIKFGNFCLRYHFIGIKFCKML